MIRSPRRSAAADRVTWRDIAACRQHDPELFFPIGSAGPALEQAEQAKRICARCPVQARCLRWALDRDVAFGIWGGTTEDERRAMRAALTPQGSAPGRGFREARSGAARRRVAARGGWPCRVRTAGAGRPDAR
jgi:WhiB family transcriptional regulator, redox-sensing transcriptional regulator